MRNFVLIAVLVIALVAISGCASEKSSSPVEGTLKIPNGLGFGGGDDGITVQFTRVENDSRCPANVECVRAGEAFVILSSSVDGGQAQEHSLEMVPSGQRSIVIDRFAVTVLELRPDPRPTANVAQGDYEIRVRIQENED